MKRTRIKSHLDQSVKMLFGLSLLVAGCRNEASSQVPSGPTGSQSETPTASNKPPVISKKPVRPGAVSLVSVGDILLGDAAAPFLARYGYDWPFKHVQPLLDNADLVLGNLEGPLTTAAEPLSASKKYSYKVAPDTTPALKRAKFDALSLANNHTLDFGVAGMRDTISNLRAQAIAPFGAGENEAEARRGLIYQLDDLRIGLLAYGEEWNETRGLGWEASGESPGCALLNEENLAEDIAAMRRHADVVLVSVHWGRNYRGVTNEQRRMGLRAIELGADMVHGHHPHVAQGVEIYRGKPIVYSLGNFVFGTPGRYPQGMQGYGLVARCIFEDKSLKWLLLTPIAVNNKLVNYQPRRVGAEEARQAFEPHLAQMRTPVRWSGDTAYIGFASNWMTAPLPALAPASAQERSMQDKSTYSKTH